jgi:DnaJ-class molecular chaperone
MSALTPSDDCDACDGTGTCDECEGAGVVVVSWTSEGDDASDEVCSVCDGTGDCARCQGSGLQPRDER